jgi:hypothetical protein
VIGSRRLVLVVFAILAIIVTACVWSGLSITDMFSVARH